jgi:hypothetical protein
VVWRFEEVVLRAEGRQFVFICNHPARGRGQHSIIVRKTIGFPMDRTIHDPDRIRSGGQMEAQVIRPIGSSMSSEKPECGVDTAQSPVQNPSSEFYCSTPLIANQDGWRPLRFILLGASRCVDPQHFCCLLPCVETPSSAFRVFRTGERSSRLPLCLSRSKRDAEWCGIAAVLELGDVSRHFQGFQIPTSPPSAHV